MRYGHDMYSTMLLEGQASLLGLKDWRQILSPEDKTEMMNGQHDLIHAQVEMESMVQPWKENNLLPFSYMLCIKGEVVTCCNER